MPNNIPFRELKEEPSSLPLVSLANPTTSEAAIRQYERENKLPPSDIISTLDGKVSITISLLVLYQTKNLHSSYLSSTDNSFSETDYQEKIALTINLPENTIRIRAKNKATLVRGYADLATQDIDLTILFDANMTANTMLEKLEQAAVTPYTENLSYNIHSLQSVLIAPENVKRNWGDKFDQIPKVEINEPYFSSSVANIFNALIYPLGLILGCVASCVCEDCNCCNATDESITDEPLNQDMRPNEKFILTESYSSVFCQTRVKISGPGVLSTKERNAVFENGRGQGGFFGRNDISAPVRQRMKL